MLEGFETGTWTAGITLGSGSVTLDNNFKTGLYQKIGNTVNITIHARASAVSSPSGSVSITGLPFSTPNNFRYRFSLGTAIYFGMTSMGSSQIIMAYINENSNSISLASQNGNNVNSGIGASFTASSELYITGSYMV